MYTLNPIVGNSHSLNEMEVLNFDPNYKVLPKM